MTIEELQSYELVEKREIAELNSVGYYLKHKKTGAKVCLLSNDDDTGVAHILEHSVLCGSREFPVKDPFVELAKGSLNTFLNAMTYPDKTVYPIASCNDKDFQNLIHVYMDAVFYPNIYNKEEIFRQEGWHYEMDSEDGDLAVYKIDAGLIGDGEITADDIERLGGKRELCVYKHGLDGIEAIRAFANRVAVDRFDERFGVNNLYGELPDLAPTLRKVTEGARTAAQKPRNPQAIAAAALSAAEGGAKGAVELVGNKR